MLLTNLEIVLFFDNVTYRIHMQPWLRKYDEKLGKYPLLKYIFLFYSFLSIKPKLHLPPCLRAY